MDIDSLIREVERIGIAYLIPAERFIFRLGAQWRLDEPLGREGIKHHLLERDFDLETITHLLKSCAYLRVYGADCFPHERSIVFRDGRFWLNTWVPPELVPKAGPFPRITSLLSWLTANDPAGVEWLMQWIAAKVQDPSVTPKVAVVLGTEPGGGKGTLAYVIRQMLGPENCATIKQGELENRFNARWIGKLFVLADEVLSNENYRDVSELLKVLIDGNEIELERKGKDQRAIRNKLAWIFASNDRVSPVKIDPNDRRYTVFSNYEAVIGPNATVAGREHDALLRGLFGSDRRTPTVTFLDEIAGFWTHLSGLKVDYGLIHQPYANEARARMIEASTSAHELFFRACEAGELGDMLNYLLQHGTDYTIAATRVDWDFGAAGYSVGILFALYVDFCRRIGAKPLKLNRFGVALNNRVPQWSRSRVTTRSGKRAIAYLPPLAQAPIIPAPLDLENIVR